jgi:hypothetical protein
MASVIVGKLQGITGKDWASAAKKINRAVWKVHFT